MESTRASGWGLLFFAAYLAFYGGFVLVSAFAPGVLKRQWIAGLNLAVVWGFALIFLALVLSLIYGWLSRTRNSPEGAGQ